MISPPPRQHPPEAASKSMVGEMNRDVDKLQRFSRPSRRMRMRLANHHRHNNPNHANSHQSQLHNFERHAVQRRSMPEIQRADVVYLRWQPESQIMQDQSGQKCRSEECLNSSEWKPRTEFERSYFGDIRDGGSARPSSSLNYYECNDHRLLPKDLDSNSETKKFDQNSNLISPRSLLRAYEADDDLDPAEIPRRIDDYVVPHSPEFRTSRERLHEIFEHNRYLRRKFFGDLPPESSGASSKFHSSTAARSAGAGFGSTETLTSQSNHSAGSSTDGRKSRADFGNTPDSVDEKISALPLTYFGADRNGGTWRCATNRLPDSGKAGTDSIARLSVDGSAVDLLRLENSQAKSLDELDKASKDASQSNRYFASYAHVTDSSDSESKSPTAKHSRSCDDLDDRKPDSWTRRLSIERSRSSVLTSSRSLMELSTSPTVLSPTRADRRETRIERMIRRRGQNNACLNKSCSDLTSILQDGGKLLSPRLVGNALTASKEKLTAAADATGTTLPSVYGPLPYKSPRRYVEGEVTIHYRSPVRSEAKEPLSEEELARRSAENMRRVYQEERRRKYLQELHDIDSRRHTDNFIPSQKSPIPLNRYDDFFDDLSYRSHSQEQTPEPRLVARALYNFIGQSPRELTFRRGDLIFVRRQVDKNWYEGEHNAMVGLFPFNYVEIIPYDEVRALPKKPYEGQARGKFNFIAQTNLELSLMKGELVYLIRRVDENWWEGRIGSKKGIFPVSYVDVLSEPGNRPETPVQTKPVSSPAAHSMLSNGSSGGKLSMGPHHYTPTLPVNMNTTQPPFNSLPKGGSKVNMTPLNEALHIDTHSEPIPYRALYNYKPQNDDELELHEGDTVYVMEKCDDGWYVGSSQRTGYFGTFPGNYVERL